MKSTFKRWLSLLLVLSTLLSLGVLPVSAADETTARDAEGIVYNPMYTTHVPVTEAVEAVAAEDELMAVTYLDGTECAKQIREAMILRETEIRIYLHDPDNRYSMKDMFNLALSDELADSPTAGDYLGWSWSSWYTSEWSYMYDGNWQVTLYVEYYSNTTQEKWFLNQLEVVMDSLPLAGKTDYEKYRTIYQYVCDTVDYDYAGLAALNDSSTYNDDYYIFTAYACLARGKAVCQGYACLLYAMCRSAGLPVRIVTSIDHAWNIVKLDGVWYNVDSTWDGQDPVTTWKWFLLGSRSFDSTHPRESGYESWDQTHPMSRYNYHVCTDSHVYEEHKATMPATCTAAGTSADVCYYCGRRYNVVSLPALGHSYTLTSQQVATDTEAGLATYTCGRCASVKTEHTPAYVTGNPFLDVHAGAYYYDPVQWAVGKEVTKGKTTTNFGPEDTCTRAQAVTFLWRAAGSPKPQTTTNPFADVSSKAYYYDAVLWAVENDITKGISDTIFAPNSHCTRSQVVTFLYRFDDEPSVKGTNPFGDVSTGAYYYKPVLWAAENDITNGISRNTFSPDGPCTRGQVVTFLHRYYA